MGQLPQRRGFWRCKALYAVCLAAGAAAARGQTPEGRLPTPAEAPVFAVIPKVETASVYTQTLKEAPARVTVISRQDIRRGGYRTLAEALGNVPGFYVTHDGVDTFVGVRGFSLLGDYNTRILVLLNGHSLTDNVYGAMYMFGENFGVPMDLVERIEIVRGPTSALYGSNGVFATINIFTRAPVDAPAGFASVEFGAAGAKKAVLAGSAYLGRGANLLVAASGTSVSGRTAFIENDLDPAAGAWARRLDAARGYHGFAQLTWGGWSVTAKLGTHETTDDAGWFGAVVGDPRTWSRDGHSYLEAAWRRPAGAASEVAWRFSYDQYRFDGSYAFPDENGGGGLTLDVARGDWASSRFTVRTPVPLLGDLTVGAEGRADLRTLQREYWAAEPDNPLVDARRRNAAFGIFAQQQVALSPKWNFVFGVRGDNSRLYHRSVTPRAAVVYTHSPSMTVKYLYGKAFRDPSAYERFYTPNPWLKPERAKTFELVVEKSVGARFEAAVSAYRYVIDGLIEGVTDQEGYMHFWNSPGARADGVEFEGQARAAGGVELAGGVALQSVHGHASERALANSPGVLATLRASLPLIGGKFQIQPAARYVSRRLGGSGGTAPGGPTADLTVSTERLHRHFDLVFGVRDVSNRRLPEPMSDEHMGNRYPPAGRAAFVKLIWHTGE
jgi:iron complex outermembrane receptor protein